MRQRIHLTESQLYDTVHAMVNEALVNEGWFSDLGNLASGMGSHIGGSIKRGVQNMGNQVSNAVQGAWNMGNHVSNAVQGAWNKGKQGVQNMAQGVKNYAQDTYNAGVSNVCRGQIKNAAAALHDAITATYDPSIQGSIDKGSIQILQQAYRILRGLSGQ